MSLTDAVTSLAGMIDSAADAAARAAAAEIRDALKARVKVVTRGDMRLSGTAPPYRPGKGDRVGVSLKRIGGKGSGTYAILSTGRSWGLIEDPIQAHDVPRKIRGKRTTVRRHPGHQGLHVWSDTITAALDGAVLTAGGVFGRTLRRQVRRR